MAMPTTDRDAKLATHARSEIDQMPEAYVMPLDVGTYRIRREGDGLDV